ncbi:hypothetical protein KIK84_09230 [Curvibacter sp. CHRR-16]|uniref:hypothetical protein n=1 Tax=Curvibacter sp. CHRR-16 TaxID=2835872 RepID=UPI001BDA8115|nr:hypothetical protein [Curvibacter sp. CHRR-16]MBT0570511.1 hypothetical protein [Curvibacter sp. CHRR-16]
MPLFRSTIWTMRLSVLALLVVSSWVNAQNSSSTSSTATPPSNAAGGEPRLPPAEAFAACQNASRGATCTMSSPDGKKLTGTCGGPEGKALACMPPRPEQGAGSGQPPKGKPPTATTSQ